MNTEQKLKELIVSRYNNVAIFTKSIGIANSTFSSIMQRGIMNSNMSSIHKICRALQISMDKLCEGEIVSLSDLPAPKAIKVDARIDSLCTDLRTRDNITLDGETLPEKKKRDLATLLGLVLLFIRTASE